MQALPDGWSGDEKRITKTFRFAGFPQAIAFMVEVAFHCQATDHHPEWTNVHSRVAVELTTHDSGGVTDEDIALASHMNAVFARMTGG